MQHESRVGKIRSAMQPGEIYTASELEKKSGVPRKYIAALLKHDIENDRIISINCWPRKYRKATPEEMVAKRVDAAISLLERLGYTVTKTPRAHANSEV